MTVTQTLRASVITPAHVFYPDGRMAATWPGLGKDIGAMLAGTLDRFETHSTIVVDGVDPSAAGGELRDGWKRVSDAGAWSTFEHGSGRSVSVGYRDAMNPRHYGILFNADTDPGALAIALGRYNRLVPTAWRGTCAMTALNALRLTWGDARNQPRWRQDRIRLGSPLPGPVVHRRALNDHERSWGYVHTWDANSAYLGTAISEMYAWSALEQTGPMPFDPTLSGYWRLRLDGINIEAWPGGPKWARLDRQGCAWMTTPRAKYIAGRLGQIEIVDSWTGQPYIRDGRRPHPAQSRVCRTWGEHLRDALREAERLPRGTLRDTLVVAVKRTYKDATGAMQRKGTRAARADWGHTTVDGWAAQLFRTADRVHETQGVWPVAVKVDALTYADCTADPHQLDAALRVGPGLGQWKRAATVTTHTWEAGR